MVIGDDNTFSSLGDETSEEAFHGFAENPTTIALVLAQLRDGECGQCEAKSALEVVGVESLWFGVCFHVLTFLPPSWSI